jgi:hypothetical protein
MFLVRHVACLVPTNISADSPAPLESMMSAHMKLVRLGGVGLLLAAVSAPALAGFVTFAGTQSVVLDTPLLTTPPNTIGTPVGSASSSFQNSMSPLGTQTFQADPAQVVNPANFSYGANANATLTGTARIEVGSSLGIIGLGRYNMTPGVATGEGRWLESSQSFGYSFSSPISALGFFGMDFGDFGGTVTLELWNGSSRVFSLELPTDPVTTTATSGTSGAANGSLLFFGVVGSGPSDVFNSARFLVALQGSTIDVVGIDELVVGTTLRTGNTVPLPGTLALALAGLAAVGAARRGRVLRAA